MQVKWSQSSRETREAVVQLLGWITRRGTTNPTGRRIIKTEWRDLSAAVIKILERHGIVE